MKITDFMVKRVFIVIIIIVFIYVGIFFITKNSTNKSPVLKINNEQNRFNNNSSYLSIKMVNAKEAIIFTNKYSCSNITTEDTVDGKFFLLVENLRNIPAKLLVWNNRVIQTNFIYEYFEKGWTYSTGEVKGKFIIYQLPPSSSCAFLLPLGYSSLKADSFEIKLPVRFTDINNDSVIYIRKKFKSHYR